MKTISLILLWALLATSVAVAQQPQQLRRCEVIPLPGDQVSLRIDGMEKVRWHFAPQYPRPFFFPFNGPSGTSLTRMGHPGAPNHDHHRSVWFAHDLVNGLGFWSDQTDTTIRQKMWYSYRDSDEEAIMATVSGWFDGQGRELMQQDVIAALLPVAQDEHALELQVTMRPATDAESVELGRTNFGFLAVRVAKTVSVHFGGGRLTNSEGQAGETNLFGQPARWMDYSGPVAAGSGPERKMVMEGITYFDHPGNPRYPTRWHVREDGWMGASFCLQQGFTITREQPLTLRYLLHAHRGTYEQATAEAMHAAFAARAGFLVKKSTKKHRQFEVERVVR